MSKKAYNRKDFFYRRAKELGLKSRGAFKILDLDQKFRLLRPGDQVVDLGCWPGGWLQTLSKVVGPSGFVVGVDLQEVTPPAKNCAFVLGDIREELTKQRLLGTLSRKVDLVLSDLSPKLSGVKFQDQYHSYELALQAFNVCQMILRKNGALVTKIFPGAEIDELKRALKGHFPKVDLFVPGSSRKSSSEAYLVARGYRPASNGN